MFIQEKKQPKPINPFEVEIRCFGSKMNMNTPAIWNKLEISATMFHPFIQLDGDGTFVAALSRGFWIKDW